MCDCIDTTPLVKSAKAITTTTMHLATIVYKIYKRKPSKKHFFKTKKMRRLYNNKFAINNNLINKVQPSVLCYSTSAASSQQFVKFEVIKHAPKAHIGIVTLNNPTKMNCLHEPLAQEFQQLFQSSEIANNPDLAAVVLTGEGKQAFSAGGDFDFLLARCEDTPYNNAKMMSRFYNYFLSSMLRLNNGAQPVPIISAINGHAIGAGLCIAMGTDIRIVESNAKLGLTFVNLGLTPGMGSTHFAPELLGHQIASYMLLTGDIISGTRARELGLALEAVEGSENVKQRAIDIAKKIASNPSQACVKTTLQSMRMQLLERLEQRLAREADSQAQAYASVELKNQILAMQKKTNKQ